MQSSIEEISCAHSFLLLRSKVVPDENALNIGFITNKVPKMGVQQSFCEEQWVAGGECARDQSRFLVRTG
jgi:hypothetical protein